MQTTNNILLIRPANFRPNEQTRLSNAFQKLLAQYSEDQIRKKAVSEFDNFVSTLRSANVNVFIFEDTASPEKPDAIFPNNWVSFHSDGTIILYPMLAENRRFERRNDVLDSLRQSFHIKTIIDHSDNEHSDKFLEGTGSMVFDHENNIAYASISQRTDKGLFLKVCNYLNYQPVCFSSSDKNGHEIYHTNVMMSIAEGFAIICLDCIINTEERVMVVNSLKETGRQIIDITLEQMNNFAGNMLALTTNENKNILVLSQTAFDSLAISQKNILELHCELVTMAIPIIETIGGGSTRCMIAEIFLEPRSN